MRHDATRAGVPISARGALAGSAHPVPHDQFSVVWPPLNIQDFPQRIVFDVHRGSRLETHRNVGRRCVFELPRRLDHLLELCDTTTTRSFQASRIPTVTSRG